MMSALTYGFVVAFAHIFFAVTQHASATTCKQRSLFFWIDLFKNMVGTWCLMRSISNIRLHNTPTFLDNVKELRLNRSLIPKLVYNNWIV